MKVCMYLNTLISKDHLPGILFNAITILIIATMLVINQAKAVSEQSDSSQSLSSKVLSYQGTLVNSSNNPVTGTYSIRFAFYDTPTSTTPLWEETRSGSNAISVQNGLFDVMLGSLTPIPSYVWNASEIYLGVKVGNDTEMSPRELVSAVPYSIVAETALSVPKRSLNSTHVSLTSGSINSSAHLILTPEWQIIPGMESTITLETAQSLFVFLCLQYASDDPDSIGVGYIKIIGENEEYGGSWIVFSGSSTETGTKAYFYNLPAGIYTIQALGRSESGTGTIKSYNTQMSWFAFSQ